MIHKAWVFHVNGWAYLPEKVEGSSQMAGPPRSIAMTQCQRQVVQAAVWRQKNHMHVVPTGTWFSRPVNVLGKVLSTTKYNLHGGYILETQITLDMCKKYLGVFL